MTVRVLLRSSGLARVYCVSAVVAVVAVVASAATATGSLSPADDDSNKESGGVFLFRRPDVQDV